MGGVRVFIYVLAVRTLPRLSMAFPLIPGRDDVDLSEGDVPTWPAK